MALDSITFDFSLATLLLGMLIFALRVLNYSISTLRLVFIQRGQRIWSATTAFIEAFIFAVVISSVVTDLSNVTNLLSYCLGAAVGSYLGMWLESRFITSYSTVTIITRGEGTNLASTLRDHNYGVTLSHGEGREGHVTILRSSAVNRDIPHLLSVVQTQDPTAFVDVEASRAIRRGWLPGGPPRGR